MDDAAQSMLIASLLMTARLLPFGLLLPGVFSSEAPRRWGVGITLLLALSLALLHAGKADLAAPTLTLNAGLLSRAVLRELLLGLAMACGFSVLLASLFVTANLLGQMSGVNLPDVTDPLHRAMGDSSLQRYFTWLALTVFLTSGGHRELIESLIESFHTVPLGSRLPTLRVSELAGQLLAQSFLAGLRAAAPVAFCLLVATVVVALLARGMPSLGAFGTGIGVNLIVLLLATCMSLEAIVTSYQQSWAAGVDVVLAAWQEGLAWAHE